MIWRGRWPSHLTDLWPLSSSEWGAAEDEKMITVMMKSNPQCNTSMSRSLKWTSQHFRKKSWTSRSKVIRQQAAAVQLQTEAEGQVMSCSHKHEIIESAENLLNFMIFVVMSVETFLTFTAAHVVAPARGRSVLLDDRVPYLSSCRDESVWEAFSEIKHVDTWRHEIMNFNSFVFLLQFRKFVKSRFSSSYLSSIKFPDWRCADVFLFKLKGQSDVVTVT